MLHIYPFTWGFSENERKIAERSAIEKKRLLGLFSRRRRQKGAFFLGCLNEAEADGNEYAVSLRKPDEAVCNEEKTLRVSDDLQGCFLRSEMHA